MGMVDRSIVPAIVDIFAEDLVSSVTICGSYRRGKETSKDIDLVFNARTMPEWFAIRALMKKRFGLCKNGRPKREGLFLYPATGEIVKIECLITDPEHYGAAIMHATGSGEWNANIRWRAKLAGWGPLSQNSLFKTEQEIFDKLGMAFVEPKDRVI